MKIILIDYSDGTKEYRKVHTKTEQEFVMNELKKESSVEYLEVVSEGKSYDFWSNPFCSPETEF